MTASTGIELSDEIVERVNSALVSGKAVTVSYVGVDNRPHMSLRGSTHVHGPDKLAIWVRHAKGGIAEAVEANPAVGLLYRDPSRARPTSSRGARGWRTTRPPGRPSSRPARRRSRTTIPSGSASPW